MLRVCVIRGVMWVMIKYAGTPGPVFTQLRFERRS